MQRFVLIFLGISMILTTSVTYGDSGGLPQEITRAREAEATFAAQLLAVNASTTAVQAALAAQTAAANATAAALSARIASLEGVLGTAALQNVIASATLRRKNLGSGLSTLEFIPEKTINFESVVEIGESTFVPTTFYCLIPKAPIDARTSTAVANASQVDNVATVVTETLVSGQGDICPPNAFVVSTSYLGAPTPICNSAFGDLRCCQNLQDHPRAGDILTGFGAGFEGFSIVVIADASPPPCGANADGVCGGSCRSGTRCVSGLGGNCLCED